MINFNLLDQQVKDYLKKLEDNYPKVPGVEYDINKRWESGTPHHTRSEVLFKRLMDIDFIFCSDYFCWKKGGDGDNGETLKYQLDIIFEEDDILNVSKNLI